MSTVEEDLWKIKNKAPFTDLKETFEPAKHSLEAIRNAINGIEAGIYTYAAKSGPDNVEINDEAEFSMELLNPGDIIIPVDAITAGNYKIDKITDGSLSPVVTETGASKAAGRIYCTEKFETASGWAVGDLFKITFSGGSVTFGDTTTALPMAYFYGRIVREEEIITEIGSKHTTTQGEISSKHTTTQGEIASKHTTTQTDVGSKHTVTRSQIKAEIDSKHTTTDVEIGSKHTTTQADIASKHTTTQADIASKHTVTRSQIKAEIDSKHTTTDVEIGSKHTTTQAEIASKHTTTQADVASKHTVTRSQIKADIASKHTTTQAEIGSKHTTTQTLVGSKHTTTQAEVASNHTTTQSKIATVHGNVGDKGVGVDILTRLGAFSNVLNLFALLGSFDEINTIWDTLGGYDKDDSLKDHVDYIKETGIPYPLTAKTINAYVQAIGSNDNNNDFLSDLVVANANGSVLERLEHLATSWAIEFTAQPAQPTTGKLEADPEVKDDSDTSSEGSYSDAAVIKSYEISPGLDGVAKYVYVDLSWEISGGAGQQSKWMVCAGDTFLIASAVDLTDDIAGTGTFHRSGQIKLPHMDNIPFTIALLATTTGAAVTGAVKSTTEIRVAMSLT